MFILFLYSLSWAQDKNFTKITFDSSGFVTCFQKNNKVYFFDWDKNIRTPQKNVTYFDLDDYVRATSHKIKSCEDSKYIHDAPTDLLKDISEIKDQLPESVLFSIEQVSQGAHRFRTEKTTEEYIANRSNLFQPDHPEILTKLRHDTGDKFASAVVSEFTKTIAVRSQTCQSLIGTCDFYLCQEEKNPCGLDGYNLNYGYKYCSGSKFKLLDEMHSDLGKSWVTEVFQCLQRKNLSNSEVLGQNENTCSMIQKESYLSHPDCYIEAGFCQLKGSEKFRIFNLIKKELFSIQTINQGIKILKKCAAEKNPISTQFEGETGPGTF